MGLSWVVDRFPLQSYAKYLLVTVRVAVETARLAKFSPRQGRTVDKIHLGCRSPTEEATGLEPVQWEFESLRQHNMKRKIYYTHKEQIGRDKFVTRCAYDTNWFVITYHQPPLDPGIKLWHRLHRHGISREL